MTLIDQYGHLTSTGGERELHAFAERIGLNPVWYQNDGRFQHYDCTTPAARERARKAGAVEVPVHVLFAVAQRARLYDPVLTSHIELLDGRLNEYLDTPAGRAIRGALNGGDR